MKLKLISAVPAALLLVFALSGCGRKDPGRLPFGPWILQERGVHNDS